MEIRAFDIIRERVPHPIQHWVRYSDTCTGQFRSKFTMLKLVQAKEDLKLESAGWSFFEAHEGKNTSDTIGSIVKCAFLKAVADQNQGLRTSADIVELLNVVPDVTEKFSFFVIEDFPEIIRPVKADRESYVVKNIMQKHEFR